MKEINALIKKMTTIKYKRELTSTDFSFLIKYLVITLEG